MINKLSELLDSIAQRAAFATIGQSGFDSIELRQYLREVLVKPAGLPGSFLGDPVIEAGFDWQRASTKMEALSPEILHPELIEALDRDLPVADEEAREHYRFERDWFPFLHQLKSWELLTHEDPQSVLVTSGTGSGKTECFMIPILDALVRERQETGRLNGVRAIMLYPLNALINSQRDRLTDWTAPFGGDIRYCLFNGETPEQIPAGKQRQQPYRELSRRGLRKDPAPLLVTNITMLEYMLVRSIDAPILEQSKGKLRWIVLDEAHTYVGSQAAELALLIRRVLRAFGVESDQVRFIATSATIGEGEETNDRLRRFMADIAGQPVDRVHVIEGHREFIDIDSSADGPLPKLDSFDATNPEGFVDALTGNASFRHLRAQLAKQPLTLSAATKTLFGEKSAQETERRAETVDLIDTASQVYWRGFRLLPLRLHLFHRAQPGLWACINPACLGRAGTQLESAEWHYGRVLIDEAEVCPDCGSPAFELVSCSECNSPLLRADETDQGELRPVSTMEEADEFSQDVDPPVEEETGDEVSESSEVRYRRLIVPAGTRDAEAILIDAKTRRILDVRQDGAIEAHLFSHEGCPICGSQPGRMRRELFRSARFGSPFLLGNAVPQILEAAPSRESAVALPFEGRQLITFTDSRQGTARFAAKLQQDAERNFIRSVLYHMVQQPAETSSGGVGDAAKLEEEIRALESVADNNPALADMLEKKRLERADLNNGTDRSVSWVDAVATLAIRPEASSWMQDLWQNYDSRFSSPNYLAEMQMFREFVRRPKRQNSAETMGLAELRWPDLDKLGGSMPPNPFVEKGLSIDDWLEFLYTIVTHTIRANTAVAIDHDVLRWIGLPGRVRSIVGPGKVSDRSSGRIPWPVATGRGRVVRPVRLLAMALAVDPDEPYGQDVINECLETAWRQIQPLGRPELPDFQIDFRKAALAPMRKAWLCPVTSRIVDTAFGGVTPYLPVGHYPLSIKAQSIELPRFPFAWQRRGSDEVSEDEIQDWLESDELVQGARDLGVWSDLHDRIALFAPYFRVAEHSAQQSSTTLQRYEAKFKRGEMNILSCSTTMEMGVDIGGISTVVMTNVPPAPASYRQRVGRAGRRDEARATGLTFCKDTPLGWEVFRNTTWPFDTPVRPPSVSLDSPVIVQRHINALLLSSFLKQETAASGDNTLSLEAGWFFGREPESRDQSPCRRLIAVCQAVSGLPEGLQRDIEAVVAFSCLEGREDLQIETGRVLEKTAQDWCGEWDALIDTRDSLAQTDNAAKTAVDMQLKRLGGEYLLSELATRGFLPGYGFPTDVVPFVNTVASQVADREDNRFSARQFPSRQLELAIRDYAPGAEVVLDGLVYHSSGVTLNWHRPASEAEGREIQALRFAWRCKTCGLTDTGYEQPEVCSDCSSEDVEALPYLRPAGFTVDVRSQPHTDITRTSFVAPAKPWISARHGNWTSFADPSIGRFRATRQGHVFHYTRGTDGNGFALCLECGRATEDVEHGSSSRLPAEMREHRPLRGARPGSDKRQGMCPGLEKSFAICRNLMLGHDLATDVFEMQMFKLVDEIAATSIAAALPEALGRILGIEAAELGWSTVRTFAPDGRTCQSILLYDRAAGGAGFAIQALHNINELLTKVGQVLDCHNPECDRACHACLLNRDTQFSEDQLDRHLALTFLEAEVFPKLALPQDLKFFGETSFAEHSPLIEAVDSVMHSALGAKLKVWIGDDTREWDFSMWSCRPLLEKWGAREARIEIVIPEKDLLMLGPEEKLSLARMLERSRASLVASIESPKAGEGFLLAELFGPPHSQVWAAVDGNSVSANEAWGVSDEAPIISVRNPGKPGPSGREVSVDELTAGLSGFIMPIEISGELDGDVDGFGERFWKLLLAAKPDIGQSIKASQRVESVVYEDRYILSPIAVRLLLELLRPLDNGKNKRPEAIIYTARLSPRTGDPRTIEHDWRVSVIRDQIIEKALSKLGFSESLHVKNRRDLPHNRRMTVTWEDGNRLTIGLDQGLGHWAPVQPINFPFTRNSDQQVEELLAAKFTVAAKSKFPTIVYVSPLGKK